MQNLSRNELKLKYENVIRKIIQKYNHDLFANFKGYLKDDPLSDSIGWYEPENKIFFINFALLEKHYKLTDSKDHALTFLVHAICHEIRHAMQELKMYRNKAGFKSFMIEIERMITINNLYANENFYTNHHDAFLMESDAELNGIKNALLILSNARNLGLPTLPQEIDYGYYHHRENYYKYREISYDAPAMYARFMKFLTQKTYVTLKAMKSIPILSNFFDQNGKYYSVQEIIRNCQRNNVDQDIVALVLSSEYFLNRLSTLSPTELEYILLCIQITYEKYQESQKLRNNLFSSVHQSKKWLSNFFHASQTNYKSLESLADQNYYNRLLRILQYYSYEEERIATHNIRK